MTFDGITDAELDDLRRMPKQVENPRARAQRIEGREQFNYTLVSEDGEHRFQLYTRQNTRPGMADSFSCGLNVVKANGETLTLCRYNGPSHPHRNHLEGDTFEFECHIHSATERYLQAGRDPETFAVTTDRFRTLQGALHCLVTDCAVSGLETTPDEPTLFADP
ncbi:MAG: hypothetical protein H6597_03260 [Flavobacteriales bacterium]|nr:hypothetical protein [Flavobacteriales bacterium]MCB9193525.1 hypothetical protein [Flavobacteriales bacterium]